MTIFFRLQRQGSQGLTDVFDVRSLSYNDLVKMFYEPPIQIMFSVIEHSKNNLNKKHMFCMKGIDSLSALGMAMSCP